MGGVQKKKSKKTLREKFHINSWKLVLVLILLVFLAATLLRFDHIKMTDLRSEVLAADEAGDDERLLKAINNLRDYTFTHIIFNIHESNGEQRVVFGTGAFYLENRYKRDAEAAIAEAQKIIDQGSSNTNTNGNIYKKVSQICDAQGKRYGWNYPDRRYLSCYTTELQKYPAEDSIVTDFEALLPPTETYRYDFASPIWCACPSGIVILIGLIIILILLIRLIIWIFESIAIFLINHTK